MRPELQAKLLQHMNKKKADKGFTLVELLVVIVIIGILTAIALPNFLSQSAKAKQSEAKQNISAINRAQIAFRTDNTTFASSFDLLALGTVTGGGTSSTATYDYTVAATADNSNSAAVSKDTAVKGYAGGTIRATNAANLPVVTALMCEANAPGTGAVTAVTVAAAPLVCGSNTTAVK